jgi:hypothetical protein
MKVSRRFFSLSLTVCLVALGFGSPAHDLRAATYTIHLQAQSGHYVVAEGGGGGVVNANRTSPGAWETFSLDDAGGGALNSGDVVFFRTANNDYLRADNCGGAALIAQGYVGDNCEAFAIFKVDNANNILWGPISNGDQVALQTWDWYWVVAEGGGGGVVNADRISIGAWEKFFITM